MALSKHAASLLLCINGHKCGHKCGHLTQRSYFVHCRSLDILTLLSLIFALLSESRSRERIKSCGFPGWSPCSYCRLHLCSAWWSTGPVIALWAPWQSLPSQTMVPWLMVELTWIWSRGWQSECLHHTNPGEQDLLPERIHRSPEL